MKREDQKNWRGKWIALFTAWNLLLTGMAGGSLYYVAAHPANLQAVSGLETETSGLETEISGLGTEISGLETETSGLGTETLGLETQPFETETETSYVLYIGLNDKDTYEQSVETEDAQRIVTEICLSYAKGYTHMEAKGGWIDEKEQLTQENTLVYYLRGVDKADIKNIMDQIITELNQNSILLEEKTDGILYYYGGNGGDSNDKSGK